MYLIIGKLGKKGLVDILAANDNNRIKIVDTGNYRTCVTTNEEPTIGWWNCLKLKLVLIIVILFSRP